MGKQSLKQWAKDIIAWLSWKVFLRAIGMTADEYWREVYKSERNKMCIDTEISKTNMTERERIFNISEKIDREDFKK
jgi:hypothetical protein